MATTYSVRRVVAEGGKVFADVVVRDDTVGEFNYGRWLTKDECAALASIPIGEVAESKEMAGVLEKRMPSALEWRTQTKAAEEYALAHPDVEEEG